MRAFRWVVWFARSAVCGLLVCGAWQGSVFAGAPCLDDLFPNCSLTGVCVPGETCVNTGMHCECVSFTPSATATGTATNSPTRTATATTTLTTTASATSTVTSTGAATATATSTPTRTSSSTPSVTATRTVAATA